jgi:hypothetical protein
VMLIEILMSKNIKLCSSVTEISEKNVPFERWVGVKQSKTSYPVAFVELSATSDHT